MKKLIILLIFLPSFVFADGFLLVKEVWGKVNLIHSSNKKEPLKEYSVLKEGQSIELVESKCGLEIIITITLLLHLMIKINTHFKI